MNWISDYTQPVWSDGYASGYKHGMIYGIDAGAKERIGRFDPRTSGAWDTGWILGCFLAVERRGGGVRGTSEADGDQAGS